MSSRRNFPGEHMYGGRSGRPVDSRDGIPGSHLGLESRRHGVYGADDNSRVGRGKATAEDDSRLGSRSDHRNSSFVGGSKSRGNIEHAHRRADGSSSYATIPARRGGFRDDSILKVERSLDDTPLRGEGSGRFRDSSSRTERANRSTDTYADDPKWMRNGNYDSLNYEGVGSLRDSDFLPVKSSSSGSGILPGFIFECNKRTILDFSSQKGTFILSFDDRRLTEQVGRGTKIFLLDINGKELHGVFQADFFATVDLDSNSLRGSKVKVRVAKECLPLTERQFKDIIHENYYSNSKFTESLTKEQVMKLLQTFRPVDDPVRHGQLSLPSSRRILDSSLPQSSSDFHALQDEIIYRKDERWRRSVVESRSLGSHPYHAQHAGRVLSKLPGRPHSKGLDEYEVYGDDDDVIENIPLSSSRLVSSSNLYRNSRGKQQSLRSLPGPRTAIDRNAGNVGHNEPNPTEGDWGNDIDPSVSVYRRRRPVSISPLDDTKGGDGSVSPPWKDVLSRADEAAGEMYERSGKGLYKEEISYLTRRPRGSDIDLNISPDMGHVEPVNLHDMELKSSRRVWDSEDGKRYSVSPSKGRSVLPRSSSLRLSDHLPPSNLDNDYDEQRLDSRLVVSRKDYPLGRSEDKGWALSSSFSNGKFGKLHQRTVPYKSYAKERPEISPVIRRRPASVRDMYGMDSMLKSSKVPLVKIKTNLLHGRGKPERVVTLVNSSQPRLGGVLDRDSQRAWKSANNDDYSQGTDAILGRKRKPSVWSRITLPSNGLGQKVVVSQGRSRVFSRLGSSTKTAFESREDSHVYKKRKLRTDSEPASEKLGDVVGSPDALEGEDYLHDDPEALEGDKETEKDSVGLQGWTRKKNLAMADNLGEGSSISAGYSKVDSGPNAQNSKGVRRKLVRPSLGMNGQDGDGGWEHLGSSSSMAAVDTLRGHSDSLDMDMANVGTQDAEGDSPIGSPLDLNLGEEEDNPDFKDESILSL